MLCRLVVKYKCSCQTQSRPLVLLDENGYPPEWSDDVFDQVLDQVENYKEHQSAHAYIVLIQTIIRLWLQNRNRKILMNMITPSKEQSKRSAAHIFAAFQYQWDYICATAFSHK